MRPREIQSGQGPDHLVAQSEWLATGRQDAQGWTVGQHPIDHLGAHGQHVFAVVEDEQAARRTQDLDRRGQCRCSPSSRMPSAVASAAAPAPDRRAPTDRPASYRREASHSSRRPRSRVASCPPRPPVSVTNRLPASNRCTSARSVRDHEAGPRYGQPELGSTAEWRMHRRLRMRQGFGALLERASARRSRINSGLTVMPRNGP